MTTLRIKFQNGAQLGPKFKRNRVRDAALLRSSARTAAQEAQTEFLTRGRRDIESAGRFGRRWTQGLTADITEGSGRIILNVKHAVSYFMVFQRGKVIHGKPLLWIPLSFARDAQGLSARDYPGQLFRVNRKGGGAPLLLSARDKKPKYFGKRFVRIPKKFHVLEIGRDVARKMKDFYRKAFRKAKGGK